MLRSRIQEDDVIDLTRISVTAPILSETGDLVTKRVGIHQGSSLSQILSNIYLMELDGSMGNGDDVYCRYADDILILTRERGKGLSMLEELKTRVEALGLRLNTSKTLVGNIEEGFDYLGYHFDRSGKAIPAKAEESLTERLEGVWLSERIAPATQLLKKCSWINPAWDSSS